MNGTSMDAGPGFDLAPDQNQAPPQAPEWVELIPGGTVAGRDGRSWINDSPEKIVEAFSANKAPLPIDMEHATDKLAPQGLPAPAVGWIEEVEIRAGAVWGRVAWTTEGKIAVESRAYRYLSPVHVFERATGRIVGLASAALTNTPNLFLPALNREEEIQPETGAAKALGLPESAPESELVAAINQIKADRDTATSLDKYVPRQDYDAALARAANAEQSLASLLKAQRESDIESAITLALAAGKITPATADYHRAQCRAQGGLERFLDYVAAAPAVGQASGLDGKKPGLGKPALDQTQKAINTQLGITDADWEKYKDHAGI